jgi:hypothetical protein
MISSNGIVTAFLTLYARTGAAVDFQANKYKGDFSRHYIWES